uniref:Ajuba LIM protein n=2 Tax=Nothobranchius korthausae TaxID=1143690 RepID=A0A1A8G148_9TELE
MEHYQGELELRAAALMDDLSLYDAYKDGMFSTRRDLVINPDLDFSTPAGAELKTKPMNGTAVLHQQHHTVENFTTGNKVYMAAPVRPVNCSRTVPVDFCAPQRDAAYAEEGCCTKSEVALPCYSGTSERHRRYSLEVQGHRYSTGSTFDGVPISKAVPLPGNRCNSVCITSSHDGRYNAASPRSSLASSQSSQEQSKHASPRSSISSPRTSLVVPGQDRYTSPRSSLVHCEGNSVLSPRSSYASTASDTSKHSSPRTSLNSCDCCSKPSSNRTSGISLGYDSRYSASGGLPPQQPTMQTAGSVAGYGVPGRAGGTPIEAWTLYLEGGMRPGTYDSRHSYPPAVGSPAAVCYQAGPDWWEDQEAGVRGKEAGVMGERARYSDLPGTRYQEELTRLLLRDAAREGEGLLDGLRLKDQSLALTSLSKPASTAGSPSAGCPVKPQEDQGASAGKENVESRQEFFGTCVKCGKGVYGADNACQALDSLYHSRCFTCVSCGRTLRNKDFYNVSGSVYCKEDYMFSGFQAAAEKCSVCGHLILEQILQAVGNSYHPGCFRCVVCSKALDGVPFTVDQNSNIYCVADYNKTFAPKCAACLQPILPTEGSEEILRVVSMNKDYHFECYHCEECGKQLSDKPGSQCFPLDSHLLCHSCHMNRVCVTHTIPPH